MYFFPSHIKYVAMLPWEVKKFKFAKLYKRYNNHILCDTNETLHVI